MLRFLNVVPPPTVKPVAFEVNPTPLTDVALAAPRIGVVIEQLVARQTTVPVPLVVKVLPHEVPVTTCGMPVPGG
jgi:hypothetical protein